MRRILFWAHLSCGVLAGLFILSMSVTGVLLTYEHQMVDSAVRRNYIASAAGQQRLTADELAVAARAAGGDRRVSLVFDADPGAPVTVSAVRETVALLNPVTGATITDAAAGPRGFFRAVENWHRWLGGSARSPGAILLDYANLLFLFITLSGLYLWLPAVWRWRTVRGLLLFQRKYINAKVRDFNWHHVFGAWMLVPLFLIALSGVVMSFPWANNLVYATFGEQAPQRGGGPIPGPGGGAAARPDQRLPGAQDGSQPQRSAAAQEGSSQRASLQQLLDATTARIDNWQRVTLPLTGRGERVELAVELRSDERRPPRRTVVLNRADASVVEIQGATGAATPSRGQQARTWLRFVHTGEQYGIVGQTIAGLASLAACFLVYTGLALAWRRL
ncbi:MAG TPA: PepSY-associated TM helix domain-containing protein, partial [Steroidobacteraceae bacterium]|nr:PepSY-associated TM helix domain-containing protein [Steroidobacteraceae bacterium]